jgi:hypothetical protein
MVGELGLCTSIYSNGFKRRSKVTSTVWRKTWKLQVSKVGAEVTFNDLGFALPSCLPDYVQAGHLVELTAEVPESHSNVEWARAFAKQGASELTVYQELETLRSSGKLKADCHELHFLQMALEKIGKAYVLRFGNAQIQNHRSSHDVVDLFMKNVQRDPAFKTLLGAAETLRKEVRNLAVAIEQLSPAIERGFSPQNCEYPWSDGSKLTVPVDVKFRDAWTFSANGHSTLISLLERVAQKCLA